MVIGHGSARHEARARFPRLLDEAAAGEEIEITRHGRTVARLVPAADSRALEGSLTGVAVTAAEDEREVFSTGVERKPG